VIIVSGEESTLKASYYRLMVYAALFGALSSLLTAGYITIYNQGVIFFGQVSLLIYNINFWPLILLGLAGVFIGLAIKFFGQHGGLGVAQRQYGQTGRLDYRHLPSLILQGFIALRSGAARQLVLRERLFFSLVDLGALSLNTLSSRKMTYKY
jgi:hypothetical protein